MVRVRPHVNPLRAEYQVGIVGLANLPAGREVELEIGCAEGNWLFARAAANPGLVAVGVEIRVELVTVVNERALAENAAVLAIFANANVDLLNLFLPASLARVFVNFPDPWFKKRHHKRRVMDAGLVDAIAGLLVPGGELFFQSDVFDLALDAMATIEDDVRFANDAGAWSFLEIRQPARREITPRGGLLRGGDAGLADALPSRHADGQRITSSTVSSSLILSRSAAAFSKSRSSAALCISFFMRSMTARKSSGLSMPYLEALSTALAAGSA